jgi:hypothetical protein
MPGIVMLGKPEPLVIPAFGVLRQIERIAEGLGRIAAQINRRQVQNREGNHRHLQFSDNLPARIAGTARCDRAPSFPLSMYLPQPA